MIRQTRAASRQFETLIDYYIEKKRYDAAQNLMAALRAAAQQIAANPNGGMPHPRPYPGMARWGFRWIKVHRYWFGWSMEKGYPVLTNVHYDTSEIPERVAPDDANEIPI